MTSESSDTDSSWEGDGCEHPKYYRKGGYHPVSIGDVYNKRYRVVHKLGWGYYSTVWLVYDYEDEDERFKALKIQKSEEMFRKAAEEEIEIHKVLTDDTYINIMLDNFLITGKFGEHYCMVFSLMGSSLYSAMEDKDEGLPVRVVKIITKKMLEALEHIHENSIIHTDIKAENVLLSKPNNVIQHIIDTYVAPPINEEPRLIDKSTYILSASQKKRQKKLLKTKPKQSLPDLEPYNIEDYIDIKICDFGTSLFTYEEDKPTEIQTRYYTAPEVLLGCPYDTKVDLWSVGCVAYELLTCEILFDCDGDSENSIDQEENHLANIVELAGDIPSSMIDDGVYSYRYLQQQRFIHIKNILPESLYNKLKQLDRWEISDIKDICDFIEPLLTIDIKTRHTPNIINQS